MERDRWGETQGLRDTEREVKTEADGEGQAERGHGRLENYLPPPQLWGLWEGLRPGKWVGAGQPLQWKKVEECLQLRPRINKPQCRCLVVVGGTFSCFSLAEPEARTLCHQGRN